MLHRVQLEPSGHRHQVCLRYAECFLKGDLISVRFFFQNNRAFQFEIVMGSVLLKNRSYDSEMV